MPGVGKGVAALAMGQRPIIKRSGLDPLEIFRRICADMCRGVKGRHSCQMFHEWESSMLRYPLLDHASVWKVKGGRARGMYFVVCHSYWNDRSEEQFGDLKDTLEGSSWTVLSRDAVWDNREATPFRQVFVMGRDVPPGEVLSMPYDRFDSRCSGRA